MMNKKPNIDKLLQQIAAKLPATFTIYDSFGIRELPNRQLAHERAKFSVLSQESIPVTITDNRQFIKVPKQRLWPVNHVRRLRKAYADNKEVGVKKYIDWVREQNKLITNTAEQMAAMKVVNDILLLL